MQARFVVLSCACIAACMLSCSSKENHLMNNPADEEGSDYVGHEVRGPNDPGNAPIVVLEDPTTSLLVGMPHTFRADASDPNPAGIEPGTVASYAWDFGDGTALTNGSPTETHSYDETGVYTVAVSVTDNDANESHCSVRFGVKSEVTPIELPHTWSPAAQLPTARNFPAAAALDGWLYVAGGYAKPDALDNLEVYVPEWFSWVTGPPMPTPRYAAAAAAVDGLLYVVGGQDTDGTPLPTLEMFDPGPGTWSAGPPMPTPRFGLAAVEAGGKLYAIGGSTASGSTAPSEIFDPRTSSWTTGPPLPTSRGQSVGARIGSQIFVVGGGTDSLDVFNMRTNAWSSGTPMPHGHLRVPVAAAIGGRLYVLGDYGGTGPNDLSVYDPTTDSWSEGPPLESGRWDPGGAAVDGRLFVVGGSRLPCDDSIWCIFGGINPVGDVRILGW